MSREIDRQIAELMGYNVIVSDTYDYWYYSEKYKGEVPIPPFSISWEAMRLLVEWLQGKGLEVLMFSYPNKSYDCDIWDDNLQISQESAETAPLALCKAVLSMPPEVLK